MLFTFLKFAIFELKCLQNDGFFSHGECPDEHSTKLFIELCERLIRKYPLSVIGVHCTHGYNRTGFLICAYLIEKLDWRYVVHKL